MIIERLPEVSARLICVSPSHQYPTGTCLPLPRRLALLNWAAKRNALILEDEHDSEFRYDGKMIPALKSLDEQGRVIYSGTFAKVLFPGLAAGYLVLPEDLVEYYARARVLTGEQIPYLLQEALAQFIRDNLLDRHIARMKDVYKERKRALLDALASTFAERASVTSTDAGMHLLVQFDTRMNSQEITAAAASKGIGLISTAPCYFGKAKPREFVLGYGDLSERQLREGVKRLAAVIRK
jgi:GntR family transcriptional regulator/MocR family aminotransferase